MLVYSLKDMIENAHLENLEFKDGYRLIDEKSLGRFESSKLPLIATNRLVVSWNTLVEIGAYVEVFVRVQVKDVWSPWMTYGKWCRSYSRGSVSDQVFDGVQLDIDEVVSKEAMTMCQLAFEVATDSSSPIVKDLFIAIETEKEIQETEVLNIDLEVPMVSQMLIHDIGTIACSPTALTMVLNYYGLEINALDVARNSYDTGSDMYGNWAYNVAFAGACNFEAYVDYCYDITRLMTYIQSGIPIVASVRTPEVITGAPQAYPEGHLMVIRGFLQEDQAYIIVNDPASKTEKDVKRYYKLEDFLKIWRHVIYVVRTKGKDIL